MSQEVLSQRVDPMQVIQELMAENKRLTSELIASIHNTPQTGTAIARTRKPAVRTLDTKTGSIYHAHSAAGKAVAGEYGLRVHNFVWYEVIAKDPTRFKDVTEEQYQAYLKTQEAKLAASKAPAGKPEEFVDLKEVAKLIDGKAPAATEPVKAQATQASTTTPPTAVKAEVKATTTQNAQKKG